ncbi:MULTISPECIES: glutathione peroxidase [Caproicibacterium]|uniref:Glutathione peroxidase n=1 Tax=Caproicibacterium argilliputei TaxID=3030016 RepID=A0AA97DB41_9FIRM|nr:glutathione peroxidase [Caproicibacterium argilliputei]WOC32997.1 glutathione peroxidase [Caproicibacterium argilliputei]
MGVYDFQVKNMKGEQTSLSDYKGKLLLIVNTASKCGFTPQYDGLEKLYKTYQDRGLVILGFPCNQFLAQEPENNEAISSFCKLNYGVTFPLFSKIDVRGENADPLFKYLTEAAPFQGFELSKESGRMIQGVVKEHYPDNLEGNGIKWNFTKFLIGRDGEVKGRYEPTVTPEELAPVIEAAL